MTQEIRVEDLEKTVAEIANDIKPWEFGPQRGADWSYKLSFPDDS